MHVGHPARLAAPANRAPVARAGDERERTPREQHPGGEPIQHAHALKVNYALAATGGGTASPIGSRNVLVLGIAKKYRILEGEQLTVDREI